MCVQSDQWGGRRRGNRVDRNDAALAPGPGSPDCRHRQVSPGWIGELIAGPLHPLVKNPVRQTDLLGLPDVVPMTDGDVRYSQTKSCRGFAELRFWLALATYPVADRVRTGQCDGDRGAIVPSPMVVRHSLIHKD